ncbi:unnamed protein product, partial [Polarella glacialis]
MNQFTLDDPGDHDLVPARSAHFRQPMRQLSKPNPALLGLKSSESPAERTCDDDSVIDAALSAVLFIQDDIFSSLNNDSDYNLGGGCFKQQTSKIKAVLAQVCFHFQVAAAALVTPSGSSYQREWHIAEGSGFQRPRSSTLKDLAFFGMLANHDVPLIIQDASEYCPSLHDRLKTRSSCNCCTSFRFYAEAVVRGRRSQTILGTLCLADGAVFDLNEVQRDQLQNYADILYQQLLDKANLESESDDFMLPHLTHPSKRVSDWQGM